MRAEGVNNAWTFQVWHVAHTNKNSIRPMATAIPAPISGGSFAKWKALHFTSPITTSTNHFTQLNYLAHPVLDCSSHLDPLMEPAAACIPLAAPGGENLVRHRDRIEEHQRAALRGNVAHTLAPVLTRLAHRRKEGRSSAPG